jgi:hypothetical protein
MTESNKILFNSVIKKKKEGLITKKGSHYSGTTSLIHCMAFNDQRIIINLVLASGFP